MQTHAKLGSFAIAASAVFASAWLVGSATSPEIAPKGANGLQSRAQEHGDDHTSIRKTESNSLRVIAEVGVVPVGESQEYRFRVEGSEGIVRNLDEEGGKQMHMIVVRRDLVGYQHLHPQQLSDGTWTTPLTLPSAGQYAVFFDFSRDDQRTVLTSQIAVAGTYEPVRAAAPSTHTTVDGYAVRIVRDPEKPEQLEFQISRDGQVIKNLQEYVGARGHLVALHHDDLEYMHVHPIDAASSSPTFAAHFKRPGEYRLFLQFKHNNRVHTAVFDQEVPV